MRQDVDDVPVIFTGDRLVPDFFAGPVVHEHLDAGPFPAIDIGFLLRMRVGAAPGDEPDSRIRADGGTDQGEQDRQRSSR